jgi:hypothetical protein
LQTEVSEILEFIEPLENELIVMMRMFMKSKAVDGDTLDLVDRIIQAIARFQDEVLC